MSNHERNEKLLISDCLGVEAYIIDIIYLHTYS